MREDLRGALIGQSAAIKRLRELVPQVAVTDAGVLIIGEAGTGREQVARLIHQSGPRKSQPFASVGCPGYPWSDEFDELFGGQDRPGLLQTCAQGTIFLSAIDELPGAMQGKIARFVEDAAHGLVPSPRLIASAKQDLKRQVAQGKFRRDLYYRLTVVTIKLVPLRERREDIPALARFFLENSAQSLGKRITGISDQVLDVLMGHRWHGNLVELAAAIERAVIVEQGSQLSVDSLPPSILPRIAAAS